VSTGPEDILWAITRAARELAVSPDPLPVPAQCHPAYDRYVAELRRSPLAASTRTARARCVRRFLRWLLANTADLTAVLTQPPAWHTATTRFIAELACGNGPFSTDVQAHRFALADCACRLGLADTYVTVPGRFRWIDDAYAAAAATTGQATATREANRGAVRAFLRWLHRSGYTGDLRRDWTTATSGYLQHLAGKGNAASTILRQRAGLNDCASCLALPRVSAPASPGKAGRGSQVAAGWADTMEATGDC
jgi:hypothetical protein